jgi:hypothetical protein
LISIYSKNMYTSVTVRLISLSIGRKILTNLRNINLEDYIDIQAFLADWRVLWRAKLQ